MSTLSGSIAQVPKPFAVVQKHPFPYGIVPLEQIKKRKRRKRSGPTIGLPAMYQSESFAGVEWPDHLVGCDDARAGGDKSDEDVSDGKLRLILLLLIIMIHQKSFSLLALLVVMEKLQLAIY